MTEAKRGLSPTSASASAGALVLKKARAEGGGARTTKEGVPRTSSLPAPTMLLSGHGGPVYGLAFSPDGTTLASASVDRTVFLWGVGGEAEPSCENEAVLAGHRNAVLDLDWAAGGDHLVTASADGSVRAWDPVAAVQVKRWAGHGTAIANAVSAAASAPVCASGGDDGTVRIWDLRAKRAAVVLTPGTPACPVLAVAMSAEGDTVYSAGVDNLVRGWDLRSAGGGPALALAGHADTVTGLALHPAGTHLLSNAMDNTLRAWDVRPFAPEERCTAVYVGHAHSAEKGLLRCAWSGGGGGEGAGRFVAAASADAAVHVWDAASAAPVYRLPGHEGAIHAVAFAPVEPVIASGGADSNIFLGELAE